jgi:ribulose-phosphate 3-epimerase
MVMSVYPGKGGQEFIQDVVDKLKTLKKLKKEYNFLIEVDGGINENTITSVKDYADIIVSGSYITSSNNLQERIDKLRS